MFEKAVIADWDSIMAYRSWQSVASLCFLSLWIVTAWRRWRPIRYFRLVILWAVLAVPTALPLIPTFIYENVPASELGYMLIYVIIYVVSIALSRPSSHILILTALLLTWLAEIRWPGLYRGRLAGSVLLAFGVLLVSAAMFVCVEFILALVWRMLISPESGILSTVG